MRYIIKKNNPIELQNWIRENKKSSPQNLTYGNFRHIGETLKVLLKEQGYLCAYTMLRLNSVDDCHIEHMEAQSVERNQDINYKNMVACFPKDGGDVSFGYGAPIRKNKKIPILPTSLNCDKHFEFNGKGEITPVSGDVAAQETIKTLQLNHQSLIELRRAALMASGLAPARGTRTRSKPLSAKEARQLVKKVLQPDVNGKLAPFCVALSQVALSYAEREEARANRIKSQC